MFTAKNGEVIVGACVNGNVVSGMAKGGTVFYKKTGYLLVECTDYGNTTKIMRATSPRSLNQKVTAFAPQNGLRDIKIKTINNHNLEFSEYLADLGFYNYQQYGLLNVDLSEFDSSNITNMGSTFDSCFDLETVDLSGLDTSNVTDMSSMFNACMSLTELDLSSFDTSKVTNTFRMFNQCTNLMYLNLSNADFSNVTLTTNMFAGIPANCEIIVKDQAAKDFVLDVRHNLTNVKIYG